MDDYQSNDRNSLAIKLTSSSQKLIKILNSIKSTRREEYGERERERERYIRLIYSIVDTFEHHKIILLN